MNKYNAAKITTLGILFPAIITLAASVTIALADTGPRQTPSHKTKTNAPIHHFWEGWFAFFGK